MKRGYYKRYLWNPEDHLGIFQKLTFKEIGDLEEMDKFLDTYK
jgi:hypothetical protein